ncbi:MAG: protein-L-isoaspartate O-methyltransferase [Bacteroidetes bacterium GWF2_33_16]|nr:MAG: protein-L-isoaspartate O-methyltransferase [Bacteroidetes bacterium GWE2_32_14]OFY07089.1 MAG: protein-L-isoaspartate O-methyltransferase [Bacteroidetes bacterium GWF2_33_16]
MIRGLTKSIIPVLFLVLFSSSRTNYSIQDDKYQKVRQRMVREQIVARGIKDQKVIQAMIKVPRHLFVPEAYERMAYEDRPLPIGEGQTISQPYIVALMTELLELTPNTKVLEIGTGSGYQAAILGELVNEVYTIEIVEILGQTSSQLLSDLGYKNIHVKIGDGYKGWPEKAPFDAIIVTCAPSDIPKPLENQLKEGGKMIIPLGGSIVQELILLEKKNGDLIKKVVAPVRFVPMVRHDGIRY